MPNQITSAGLETATRAELLAYFTTQLQNIYGVDINLASDSPDGQWLNIEIQAILDLEDFLTQINAGFDPDQALGNILDQRVAINGIQRIAGTFTVTNISITVNQSVTLTGLNDSPANPYTVRDGAGNQWQLISTANIANATYPYTTAISFQSAVPGAVLTTPNTITIPVTVVLGVTAINNPTVYTSLGVNEESDAVLKIRRLKSVSIGSIGFQPALEAVLRNINGVVSATVFENYTDAVDASGVPGHSIWVVIDGPALSSDPIAPTIADAIYKKRASGCGMFGAQVYTITQSDGTSFNILWDVVVPENLYIKFTATSLDGVNLPNTAAILAGLPSIYTPLTNEEVNINQLSTLVQQIDPNTLVTVVPPNEGFSVSGSVGTYGYTLNPSNKNKRFTVSSANISITVTPL